VWRGHLARVHLVFAQTVIKSLLQSPVLYSMNIAKRESPWHQFLKQKSSIAAGVKPLEFRLHSALQRTRLRPPRSAERRPDSVGVSAKTWKKSSPRSTRQEFPTISWLIETRTTTEAGFLMVRTWMLDTIQ